MGLRWWRYNYKQGHERDEHEEQEVQAYEE